MLPAHCAGAPSCGLRAHTHMQYPSTVRSGRSGAHRPMSHVPADANTTSLLLFAAAIASATSLNVRLYRSLHTLCRGITCDAYSRTGWATPASSPGVGVAGFPMQRELLGARGRGAAHARADGRCMAANARISAARRGRELPCALACSA